MDVIVIGAGAAGMLAAGKAAASGAKTVLIEKNERPGRKIAITGKGRCNVTNECDQRTFMENVITNPRFLYSAIRAFGPDDVMELLREQDVPLKTERGQRVFPVSDRSFDIIDGLENYVKGCGAKIVCGVNVKEVTPSPDGDFWVKTDKETYAAKAVILCTGGLSYPVTGSDGAGHRMAEKLGLEVTDARPALIPFTVKEAWCRELMGLSLKNVRVYITEEGAAAKPGKKTKPVYDDFGEMLFTHFGVSGPTILSASSCVQAMLRKKGLSYEQADLKLHIDLKPALSAEELDARLLKDIEKYKAREFRHALDDLLPRKLIPVMVRLSMIDPAKRTGDLTREERQRLGSLLKDLCLTLSGTRPLEEAIVTMGGISVKEMDPSTMMVKAIPGLFAAGELLDVDAYTGGFNLQIAFSTGALAGTSAAGYAIENRG